jgi:hypothetical protein
MSAAHSMFTRRRRRRLSVRPSAGHFDLDDVQHAAAAQDEEFEERQLSLGGHRVGCTSIFDKLGMLICFERPLL